jgi:hypothetical protein
MAAKKKKVTGHRYVLIPEHSVVVQNLQASSDDMQKGIESAEEIYDVISQRHMLVADSMKLCDEISRDLKEVTRAMPIKAMPKTTGLAPMTYITQPRRPSAKPKTISEKEVLAKSQKALERLQKNISELKSELKSAR